MSMLFASNKQSSQSTVERFIHGRASTFHLPPSVLCICCCIPVPISYAVAYILCLHFRALMDEYEYDRAGTQQHTRPSLSPGMSCSFPAVGPTIQRALTTAYPSLAVLEQQNITRVCDQDFCGSPCLAAIAWQSTTAVVRRILATTLHYNYTSCWAAMK